MFEALSDRLDAALSKIRGRGRLSEDEVDATLKEIRLALLEADVNIRVVKKFVANLRERLVGEELNKALNPAQQVVKAVNEELARFLGSKAAALKLGKEKPAVIMLAGLQGSGKTTAAGKLALLLKKKGRHPMLVACDLVRPAAVQQLKVLGEQVGVHVYAPVESGDPVAVAKDALRAAQETGNDIVIVDTAGRLHIDAEMMKQAADIKAAVNPAETLFVIDSMIGQEAVTVAKAFLDDVGFTGVILTKLDGDARGGAALSVRAVTGKPIKFASIGEKLDEFEQFHPDRMAGRILGMGDVLSLIEKAEEAYTEEQAAEAEEAFLSGNFTLENFLEQLQMIKKMGPLQGLLGMLPGVGKQMKDLDVSDKQLAHVEAIIRSMTPAERQNPKVLNGSRRKRIAAGSGRSVTEVNQLVKQFAEMQKVMKSVSKMAGGGVGNAAGAGKRRGKPGGVRDQMAQAKAIKQLQESGQLPSPPGGPSLPGAGMGGFKGLTPKDD